MTYWPVDGLPPEHPRSVQRLGAMGPPTLGISPRAPGVTMPKPKSRDFFTLKRLSPPKVTQDPAQVAQFVWQKCVARTTPIVKMSPFHKTGTVYCCMNFYHPNVVGEYV